MSNTTNNPPAVEVVGLSKHYGSVVALNKVSLRIAAGEYFVLLGPSGGGKTTLLRTIGGFHRPTTGQVFLNGVDVSGLPPEKRPTSMVFQSYALFPHMTVERNVGYGLSLTGMNKIDIRDKTHAMLEMVGLAGYQDRKPHELSGGQQQRVQLARSLVLDRNILLLDEPLAALDAQLRKDMCLELKHLQEKVGITFIHVTHNQEEAMTVADRIALIANGDLVESGDARQMYERPSRRFTASFVGENNLIEGKVASVDRSHATVHAGPATLRVALRGKEPQKGQSVTVSVRSERCRISLAPGSDGCYLTGKWQESLYLGLTVSHRVVLNDGRELVARVISGASPAGQSTTVSMGENFSPGDTVSLCWDEPDAQLHLD